MFWGFAEDFFAIVRRFVLTPFAFAEVRRRVLGSQKSLRLPVSLGTPMVLPLITCLNLDIHMELRLIRSMMAQRKCFAGSIEEDG